LCFPNWKDSASPEETFHKGDAILFVVQKCDPAIKKCNKTSAFCHTKTTMPKASFFLRGAKGRVEKKGRALNVGGITQAHLASRKTGKRVFKKMLK
jgi:hypothetical protein